METPTTFGETWDLLVEKAKNDDLRWTPSERSQFAEKANQWKKEWQKKKLLPVDIDPIQIDPTGFVTPTYVNSITSLLHKELEETHGKIQLLVKILTARTKYLERSQWRHSTTRGDGFQMAQNDDTAKESEMKNPGETPLICYNCGKRGHMARCCRSATNPNNQGYRGGRGNYNRGGQSRGGYSNQGYGQQRYNNQDEQGPGNHNEQQQYNPQGNRGYSQGPRGRGYQNNNQGPPPTNNYGPPAGAPPDPAAIQAPQHEGYWPASHNYQGAYTD